MGEPRIFQGSGRRFAEVPLAWHIARDGGNDEPVTRARDHAAEVAPGVFVAVMGWGDMLMPDHSVTRGAMIAVWADDPAGKDGSGDD